MADIVFKDVRRITNTHVMEIDGGTACDKSWLMIVSRHDGRKVE